MSEKVMSKNESWKVKQRAPVAVALVHWPVLDRAGSEVCTNVTNFDIHDIARMSRSYGVEKYFIVNRMREQLMFVQRILDHWRIGTGSKYNPMRKTALGMVQTTETLEEAIAQWHTGSLVVGTSAREVEGLERLSFRTLKEQIHQQVERPVLLVFGTGFGLCPRIFEHCEATLEPIWGAAEDQYRHLSVRSAVSICLDRLLSTW